MNARLNKQKHKQILQLMVKPIMKDEEITKKEGNYFQKNITLISLKKIVMFTIQITIKKTFT